jgi:hypothetical protein
MGTLLNGDFWADSLNQLAKLQPELGQHINGKNAARIRQIACRALSTLLDDQQFSTDLANALDLAKTANVIDAAETANFGAFLDSFMLLENKILADAGVDTVASRDLEREIRKVAKSPDAARLEQLEAKITFCKKLACDSNAVDDPKKPLWVVVWRAVKGVGLIGVDAGAIAGAAVTLGLAGGAAAGSVPAISTGYGFALLADAVKGRW